MPTCEALLSSDTKFLVAVDGSSISYVGFDWLLDDIMQKNRNTSLDVIHVTDDAKTHLPPKEQPAAVKSHVESRLVGSLTDKRYSMQFIEKGNQTAGSHICNQIKKSKAEFVIIGYEGRKGKKNNHAMHSNVYETLKNGTCSAIVIKTDEIDSMPLKRPTTFAVNVNLNQASTKAFLDTLRLSQPGDKINVVYCVNFSEKTDNIYTEQLKKKYQAFFDGIGANLSEAFTKFNDRECSFNVVTKERSETVAQCIVRYLSSINADFVAVGANKTRVGRGKEPVGSVAMQVCLEADCNYIVSTW